MTLDSILPARCGQVCPCGAPAVYGLLWRQPPGTRPALRHSLACARCAPPEAASWAPPVVALDPLPPSAGPTRPPPADLPSSSGEGEATERSAAPVEAQTEPPAVAVAGSEVGRGLPAPEPPATAEGQPTSTPDPWDGPEGRAHSEPQEAPVARAAATLPPIDPSAPPDRCRLQGCETPRFSRGLCRRHEGQVRRRGQIDLYGLPPVDPREAILRAQAARRKEAAPENAPSARPQQTPRTRRAGAAAAAAPRHEGEALRAIWTALGSPELAQSESLELEILRAAEQRLRLDAQLASRITELEEDGVRLRSQLLQLQQEIATLSQDLAACELVLDGEEEPPVEEGEVAARVLGPREALRAERARVLALTGELRQQVDRLIGQDALWLILAPAPDESLAAAALRLRLDLARREGVSHG